MVFEWSNKFVLVSSVTLSSGEYLDRSVFDARIQKNKEEYTEMFLDRHCYEFCEHCKKNKYGCSGIARSHIISVKECINMSMAELAYCILNLELLGLRCHRELENMSNEKRKDWYYARATGLGWEEWKFYYEKGHRAKPVNY